MSALVGCAAVPPEPQWVCEIDVPCYRVAEARPYPPAYGYGYGYGYAPAWLYGGNWWSRPSSYSVTPVPATSVIPSAPASSGVASPRVVSPSARPTTTTPGRRSPLSFKSRR